MTTDTGYTLDFSSLILKTGQYSVTPDDAGSHYPTGLIYINLCRPLNPIFGTLCPPGSGACLDRSNSPPLVSVARFFFSSLCQFVLLCLSSFLSVQFFKIFNVFESLICNYILKTCSVIKLIDVVLKQLVNYFWQIEN